MGNSTTPEPLDIAEMITAAQTHNYVPGTETVDISDFLGAGAVVVLRELDTREMFTVPKDGNILRKRNPDLPVELCQTIAMLALAHHGVAAPGEAAILYTLIARKNRRLFTRILGRYRNAFPDVVELGGDENARGEG